MKDEEFEEKWELAITAECPNSPEVVAAYSEILQAKQCEEYLLHSFETAWQWLSFRYGKNADGGPLIERATNPAGSTALEKFSVLVDQGFYPPPEIMLSIADCFQRYLSEKGDVSLDEIFFGKPHKKRDSFSFKKSHYTRYLLFHMMVQGDYYKNQHLGEPLHSLEEIAEVHLALSNNPDIPEDIDTFLRGYRRWKREYKIRSPANG